MNTMEITKFVGAICGSLLAFLLIQFAAGMIFDTHSDVVAFSVPVEDGEGEAAPEEEVDVAALVAAADASAGEGLFRRCAACHKIDGADAVGPHLNGVYERDIASVAGFGYSDALTGIDGVWDAEHLFGFLANPKVYAPGTIMSFAGLPKPQDRANVIAYLASLN